MSKDSKRKIVTLNGDLKADNSAAKAKAKTTKLLEKSLKEGYFVTATISGTRTEANLPVAVVMMDGYEILIPYHHCVDLDGIKRPNDNRSDLEIAKFALDRRINSEIDFIVANIVQKDGFALASRKAAMDKKAAEMYSRKDGDDFLLRPGVIAEARVVAVLQKLVIVELQGVETKVPIEDLIYHRAEDATSLFKNGQTVPVLIKDIVRHEDGQIDLKVSVKETQEHPFDNHKLEEGGKYTGVVTQINVPRDAKPQIFILLQDGNQVLSAAPERSNLYVGQHVVVEITLINEELKRIFGKVYE